MFPKRKTVIYISKQTLRLCDEMAVELREWNLFYEQSSPLARWHFLSDMIGELEFCF